MIFHIYSPFQYNCRYGTNPTTPSCQDESESPFAGFEGLLVPGNIKIDDDGKDVVVAGKHSQVVTANKMLADLLERKSSDPPFNVSGDISNKRKIDANANPTSDEPPTKRLNYIDNDNSIDKKNATKSSSSAANLYAKLAASLLEDEDMELDETMAPTPQQSQPVIPSSTIVEQPKSVITVPMQRQIIVSPNNGKKNLIFILFDLFLFFWSNFNDEIFKFSISSTTNDNPTANIKSANGPSNCHYQNGRRWIPNGASDFATRQQSNG